MDDVNKLQVRKTNYVAILALIVVMTYCVVAGIAIYRGTIDFKEFSAVLGPLAGLLVGYMTRDLQSKG